MQTALPERRAVFYMGVMGAYVDFDKINGNTVIQQIVICLTEYIRLLLEEKLSPRGD